MTEEQVGELALDPLFSVGVHRALGLTAWYAITPTVNSDDQYEVPRIGVHSSSLAILGFKMQWGSLIEPLRYQVTGRV